MIPSLNGLAKLLVLYITNNQLTGSLPSLESLTKLSYFSAENNQLTGSIPSLDGLSNLYQFYINNNYLSGSAPSVPTSNNLQNGSSSLCPNNLVMTSNSAWDAATGLSPWYMFCSTGPAQFSVNYDGNGSTGGSVPNTGALYNTGQMVSVLGNTGFLSRTGYSFDGWNTSANGTGISYSAGSMFTMGTDNVILHARWLQVSRCEFSAQGPAFPILMKHTGNVRMEMLSKHKQDRMGGVFFSINQFPSNSLADMTALFKTHEGVTELNDSIEIGSGCIEIANIIIQ